MKAEKSENQITVPGAIPLEQLEEIINLQARVLENACVGADTRSLLEDLCLSAEKLTKDALASIMVYDESRQKLFVHTAPSLPRQAIEALDGLDVGQGSCGNAVYNNSAQYVCSTLTDERWSNVRDFATSYNINACWSCPIRDKDNQPVGSFALSSFEVREPTAYQKKLLSSCASIAGILFQRIKLEEQNAENARLIEEDKTRLSEAETRYRTMIENSADAIFLHKESGEIIDVNSMACDYLGYSAEELVGMYVNELEVDLVPGRDFTQELDEQESVTFDGKHRRKDGTIVHVEIKLRRFDIAGNKNFIGVVRNISDRKKIEHVQLTASKLESIGVLAGGIAHDFNNLLGSVMGNIDLASTHCADEATVKNYLLKATNASRQAAELTQQLLTFSRGGEPVRKNADIAEVVRQSCEFSMHGSNIEVQYDIADGMNLVKIDSGQISQVIQNLVINARQAMPGGGKLTMTCSNATVGNLDNIGVEPGEYVLIGVRDEGIGIPRDQMASIFDPYFTTKQEGSGLGLALSYSIVGKHGGAILVESEPGVGTEFRVYIPVTTDVGTVEADAGQTDSTSAKNAVVLLMDDDEMLRLVSADMLQCMGHQVLLAADGVEAIRIFSEHYGGKASIDLLIMDLTVPAGMGGQEAMRHILEIDRDVKAIVSSGYSNDPVMANYEKFGFANAINKPYTSDQLAEVINKVIGD